jgi:hypothetical protein
MTATAAMIAELRRMVAEPTADIYSDTLIQGFIERYPMLDDAGEEPYVWSDADPPIRSDNADWTPTYNLNLAAADIWEEKAAAVAAQYDFRAGQSSYTQSQLQTQYLQMAERYRNKRVKSARPLP